MRGLILYLRQADNQRQSLRRFLGELQNPLSSNYHKFLTPEQYAERFGVSQPDMARIRTWVESQGFTVTQTARGRTWLMFQGTAEQVERAFGLAIHHYRAPDRVHYANTGNVSLPEALASVATGVGGLSDYFLESQLRILPQMTSSIGTHTLAPGDLATIYDISQLYKEGIDGSGQKIAIVGSRSMNVSDITTFRSRFGLPAKVPQSVLVPGYPDPGPNGSEPAAETALDLEWAGAVARNADLIYVYAPDVFAALTYAIDQDLAPVISVSYGGCELRQPPALLTAFQQLAQQGNAQGITWVNSSGDAGAAACDPNGYPIAQNGLAVSFPASIPEVTAAGGTQFDDLASPANYWNIQNDANGSSALSYIPEKAWNESTDVGALWAGGGGSSAFYQKPAWQAGPGMPDDGARDLPDIALTSATHDGYAINVFNTTAIIAGTSASAPVFAGILALVNQYLTSTGIQLQPGLGNVNPALYRLARSNPGVFHDITAGGNNVPCVPGSPSCTNGTVGHVAAPGYDLATGLGSPDVYNLVHQWSQQAPTDSQVVVSLSRSPVYQQASSQNGLSWSLTLTLTEEAGIATTLTDFTVNGQSLLNVYFPKTSITALGKISVTFGYATLNVPATITFGFTGIDASGKQWTRAVSVPFLGLPPTPTISGATNGASYDHAYAPGMFLSVFGTNLAAASQQTGAVPLEAYLGGLSASINGYPCPLFYVSPTQVNLQIPYEVLPGPATLTVVNAAGRAALSLQIAAAAPGVFQDASNSLVPNASGNRGQTATLFITGEGLVSPAVPDGTTPRGSVAPAPQLSVVVSIGGVVAPIQFIGIPGWAIGLTQVNFQIPPTAPLGAQQVTVTVGAAASRPVNFTVLP
jgi:uncharacterized protein (TIGR03437 family)